VIRSLIRITIEQGIKVSLATIIESRNKSKQNAIRAANVGRTISSLARTNELKILPNSELLNPLEDRGKTLLIVKFLLGVIIPLRGARRS